MAAFVLDLRDKALDQAGLVLRQGVPRSWLAESLADSDLRPGPAPSSEKSEGSPSKPEGDGDADADDDLVGDVDLVAQRVGSDIVVRGRARARLLAECSRCLEDAVIDANAEVDALFSPRGGGGRSAGGEASAASIVDEVELTPDDIQRETYVGERVVLDALLRELLILEVPMKPLCAAACPGIAHGAGEPSTTDPEKDRGDEAAAVDPRLAPLLALRGKLGEPKDED
jgi:uncharacterized protein